MNMHGKTGQGKVCGADDHAMNIILRIDHYFKFVNLLRERNVSHKCIFFAFFTIDLDRHEIHGMYMCFARSERTMEHGDSHEGKFHRL